jgi:hypothetical protein
VFVFENLAEDLANLPGHMMPPLVNAKDPRNLIIKTIDNSGQN